jgi:hypothetical protein
MERNHNLINWNKRKDRELEMIKERKYLKPPKTQMDNEGWLRLNINAPTNFIVGAFS